MRIGLKIRRDYFFLKIFSFHFTFDIYNQEERETILGIYYYRQILGTLSISNRAINFRFGLKNQVQDLCPLCGFYYTKFKDWRNGAHPDCELALKLTRGGK